MDPGHDVGAGQDDGFAAPLEGGAAVVVGAQVGELQAGAHGAVEDHHPVPGGLEIGGAAFVHRHGVVRQHAEAVRNGGPRSGPRSRQSTAGARALWPRRGSLGRACGVGRDRQGDH